MTSPRPRLFARLLAGLFFVGCLSAVRGDDLEDARKDFLTGDYEKVIKNSRKAINAADPDEEWHLLLAQSLLTTGKYPEAYDAATNAVLRLRTSIRVRLLARDVFQQNGRTNEAAAMLEDIKLLGGARAWAYTDPANLVTLGRASLLTGGDPRRVLDQYYDKAKVRGATNRAPYLASGELALDKHDYDLAAKIFEEGLGKMPEDPELHYGLARAYQPSDRKQMLRSIEFAQKINPRHIGVQLLVVDHLVDSEEYAEALKELKKVEAVNPHQPEMWAYRAIIAELQGETGGLAKNRQRALKYWKTNPKVDFLIGQKLSQKYRFAEGAASQRRALESDPEYLEARSQLATDLLRLGREKEGWALAAEVEKQDGYDVNAFNLVTLKESMDKFGMVTNEHFTVRMGASEAKVYGKKVLELLERARTNLCAKYGLELKEPVIVEIFPDQRAFAVRTFGMPGGAGYLGVCFGNVITANSPGSQMAHPSNWQAVLWHEFCHVVTLQLTKNKMPRWISEGISVFEERQNNPIWGQHMNPEFLEMTTGGDLTPIRELSGAFMAPKTGQHLQYAYYESSMVVEYIFRKHGLEAIKAILKDLGEGMEINAAIEKSTVKMADLQKGFEAFMKEETDQLAPGMDWTKPKDKNWAGGFGDTLNDFKAGNSTNYYALTAEAKKLVEAKKYAEAMVPLKKLLDLYPNHSGKDNAYWLMSLAYRGLGDSAKEKEMLVKVAAIDPDAVDVFLRLMEIGAAANDWKAVELNALRYLAVNPLVPGPHRFLGLASEALEKAEAAIESYRTLLMLDPPAPADAHFRLARLLQKKGDAEARREVLLALEEAPRYRDAQKLLLEVLKTPTVSAAPPAQNPK